MGKTLFAVSTATLMVAFIAGWAVSDSQARVTPAASGQVDTFQTMTGASSCLPNTSRIIPSYSIDTRCFNLDGEVLSCLRCRLLY